MEFGRKIYTVNVGRLAKMLLPVKLRQPLLLALQEALFSALEWLYCRFTNYKKKISWELTITPQVCYLQGMLNDLFDYTDRRIVVTEVELALQPALYLKSEGTIKGQITYKEAEDEAEWFWAMADEVVSEGGYFVVEVPAGLVYDANKMRSYINKYKLPTTSYNINEV
ncbi:MAG TPA: hypothetical protein PK327_08015 [Niabella sp.]|nr:hypothetical protein [Niabella sp.]HRB90377.1 hypothetical protein [Niabella sp.]HRB94945.1 hypothetical protein [Niabella sp.]HRC10758.1 hypothetical protein [Niabella sp.]